MRSNRKTWKRAVRDAGDSLDGLSRELMGGILDLADYLMPMIRDGRIKTVGEIAIRANPVLNSNGLLSALLHEVPWLVPAMLNATRQWPKRTALLRAWQAKVAEGDPARPRRAAREASKAVVVLMVMDCLRDEGLVLAQDAPDEAPLEAGAPEHDPDACLCGHPKDIHYASPSRKCGIQGCACSQFRPRDLDIKP